MSLIKSIPSTWLVSFCCDNKPQNLNGLTPMKTYFLLIGLQVGWTGHDPGQVQLGLGQLHYSICLFTQGPRLKKQPLFGACLLMAESIILREWGEAYSASWSLCLGHHSGPSTTFFRSKHVTWPSPKSVGQRIILCTQGSYAEGGNE